MTDLVGALGESSSSHDNDLMSPISHHDTVVRPKERAAAHPQGNSRVRPFL
jgi:hypothetical protein